MTGLKKQEGNSRSELRKFGLVMAVPLMLIATWLWWKDRSAWPYLAGLALLFAATGLLVPTILAPIEKGWMRFAMVLSAIMTRVILTLAYILVITPFGLLLRILGKDLLQLKFDPEAKSYWVDVEEDGPSTRSDKPY